MRCALLLRNCLTVRGSFPYNPFMKFQDVILSLQRFWADRGCVIRQPYDIEVGAGTFNPATFFRVLGPEPWMVAYVEPSRGPGEGRYGENPNRLQLWEGCPRRWSVRSGRRRAAGPNRRQRLGLKKDE